VHEYERLVEFEFLVCEFYYHDVDDDEVQDDLIRLETFNQILALMQLFLMQKADLELT
jgi:hypothetical protein